MGSKFERFGIGRAVARFLGIKDPKNFPFTLNTDELQPVLSVGGHDLSAPSEFRMCILNNQAMDGLAAVMYVILKSVVGSPYLLGTVSNKFSDNSDKEYYLRTLSFLFDFDVAGAAAKANNTLAVEFFVQPPNDPFYYRIAAIPFAIVTAGILSYEFNFPMSAIKEVVAATYRINPRNGQWDGFVPKGWTLAVAPIMYLPSSLGTVFPAASFVSGNCTVEELAEGVTTNGR